MKLLILLVTVLAVSHARNVKSYDDHVDQLLVKFENHMSKRGILDSDSLSSVIDSIKSTLKDVKEQLDTGVEKSTAYLEDKYNKLKAYVEGLELDDRYDAVVEKMKGVLQQMKEKIQNTMSKREVEVAFENLNDKVIKRALIDLSKRADFKEKMKVVWGKVKNKFSDLADFLKEQLTDSWEKVQPEIEQIKEMAIKVLNNAVDHVNDKVMTQATELFNKYKDELGPMIWARIEQKFKDVTGKDVKDVIPEGQDTKAIQE